MKAVRELVLWSTSYSVSSDEIRDFHCAAPEAIVTERRILNSLFAKLEEWEGNKRQVLKYLLCLIRKSYEELTKRTLSQSIILSLIDYMCAGAAEAGCSEEQDATLRSNLNDLSLKGMYDPGIISTGHSFKRMWFQKWLHEGMIHVLNKLKRTYPLDV